MSKETLAPSKVTDRDPKGLKFMSVVSASYNKAGLSNEEAQRINDTPGLSGIISDFIDRNRRLNQFADEEISSSYTYPEGYEILPIEEQVAKLKELFPMLNGANLEIAKQPLPEGAEGWAAIPRWQRLGTTYNEAFENHVLPACQTNLKNFCNYLKGELSGKYLRQLPRSAEMFERAAAEQAGYDIIIIPIQFGLRHRGRSVRRARECFAANELGLGAFAVGCLALTHPKRFQRWEQLHADCGGDEYDWYAGGQWTYCPDFYFGAGGVKFHAYRIGYVSQRFGSASAFLGSAETLEA